MSSIAPTRTDLDEQVQGLALTGFALAHMRNLILEVSDPASARRFIGALLSDKLLHFGARRKDPDEKTPRAVSIGITYEGLRALGTPGRFLEVLKEKSPAFGEGPHARAARYLGDAGVNAAERWDPVFQRKAAHVWISVHGDTSAAVDAITGELGKLAGAGGLADWNRPDRVPEGVHIAKKQVYGNGKMERTVSMVHFGFRDNITKPSIIDDQGHPAPPPPALGEPVKPQPGELLLGYLNNDKADVWTAGSPAPELVAFLRNGSFGILRQIEQHEGAFQDYLATQSLALQKDGYDFATPEYLAAKLCGRWRNGAPVRPQDVEPRDDWDGEDAAFDFGADTEGTGCPFGAHVRRANPRGDLVPAHDRTLFRRGMPYGPLFTAETASAARGLLGVFFCGRIDDQFELLVSEWLEKNPLGPPNKGRAKDPFSGHHDEPDAGFHIPIKGANGIVLKGFDTFVRTRGTLYALFPSRRALEMIASRGYGSGS